MKQSNIDVINTLALQVENHLQLAIAVYQNTNEETLAKQPASNSWSAAQCLWHINSYARFYFPLIQKAIGNKVTEAKFSSGWAGSYFTSMMNNLRRKYSAFKNHTPPDSVNPYKEVATFIDDQERLLAYLKQMENTDLNQRLPISITGLIRLKLGDVLLFIVAHNERHIQQANRALNR
jgi:uncharacterized damage-inducible protein DinB